MKSLRCLLLAAQRDATGCSIPASQCNRPSYSILTNAAMERTRELANTVIRGNHDKACAGITDAEDFNALARSSALWTRNELTPQNSAFLRSLPAGPVLLDGFELVHGSPADEDEYIAGPVQALPA